MKSIFKNFNFALIYFYFVRMILFDAHAHIFTGELGGLSYCGTSEEDWPQVAELAKKYPWIVPSFGTHPWFLMKRSDDWLNKLVEYLRLFPKAGVGEAGLDKKKNANLFDDQKICLKKQITVAHEMKRPLSLHCVAAWEPMLILLTEFKGKNLHFMFHSFSGSSEMVKRFADIGGYFSFSSSQFYPGSKRTASALLATPKERLMFESDASNISGLRNTIEAASRILSIPVEQLAEISFNNSVRFFKERI